MSSSIRLSKPLALRAAVELVPQYLEFFQEVRRASGWVRLHKGFAELRRRLNIGNCVVLYDSERLLYATMAVGLVGFDGVKHLDAELKALPPGELQRELDEWGAEALRPEWLDDFLPDDPRKEREAVARFEALSPSEKVDTIKQAQFLFGAIIALLNNAISVMVHGEKLTSLVPKAVAGDRDAFLKAIQIDKSLLAAHPRFIEQHEAAQVAEDRKFLRGIGYRLAVSPTRGPVRYPGVYLMFAMLELFGWLDDLKHAEILDLCDAARLDRWQNRIEDVNYLTKRYLGYRRMQQSGGLSMH